MLERLPGGLTCHLRSGDLPGGIFCTRFELRNADEPPSAPPLGRCDVRYFEPRSMLAGPIAMSLRMSKEACKGWASAKAGRDLGVLGTTLVERVEVFCTRLVASRTGELRGSSALLVAGWLPELTVTCRPARPLVRMHMSMRPPLPPPAQVAPFVRRDYKFHGDPDESMGSKFLKTQVFKTAAPHRSQPEKRPDAAAAALRPPPASPPVCPRLRKRRIEEVAAGGAALEITKLGTPFGARSEPAASPHTSKLGDGQSRRKTEGAEAAAWAGADNIEELGSLGKISSSALDTSGHFRDAPQPLPSHFPVRKGGRRVLPSAVGAASQEEDDEAERLLAETLGDIGAEHEGGGDGEGAGEGQGAGVQASTAAATTSREGAGEEMAAEDGIDATIAELLRG